MKLTAKQGENEISIEFKHDEANYWFIISSGTNQIYLNEDLMSIFKENIRQLEYIKYAMKAHKRGELSECATSYYQECIDKIERIEKKE